MAVFRVQKTQNYTVMSNYHLNDKALSLKAKGLLSLMLSLPGYLGLYHARVGIHLQRGCGRDSGNGSGTGKRRVHHPSPCP